MTSGLENVFAHMGMCLFVHVCVCFWVCLMQKCVTNLFLEAAFLEIEFREKLIDDVYNKSYNLSTRTRSLL